MPGESEAEEFLATIARFQDGQLPEAELAAFDETLRKDPEKRRVFIELQKRSAGIAELQRRAAFSETGEDKKKVIEARVRRWVGGWAMAAVVAVVFGIGTLWLRQGDPVAIVQRAVKLERFQDGDSLIAGEVVRLEAGRIAVRFDSGALLAVVAPAEFEIVGTNAARLLHGRATVRVPGKIKGFVLDTPSERVVDLGTAFGVSVEPSGATAISVFEGEIRLSANRHLFAGQSVALAPAHSVPREIPYTEGVFAETWQISFGIDALAGKVRLAAPSERPTPGKVHDTDSLLLFPERENVPLAAGYRVDATEPGTHRRPFRKREVKLANEVRVDSFLLQYNPTRSEAGSVKRKFQGELKFDRPIVGLILQKDLLIAADSILALPGADFSNIFRRGINVDDEVSLSGDRLTLGISFDLLNGIDQIRVLVASDSDTH